MLLLVAACIVAAYWTEPTEAAPARKRPPASIADEIDRRIDRALAEAKVPPSPLFDDAEFIRRLSLDLRGRVPTAERVRTFLEDTDPDKRAKLIDEFLADADFGDYFGRVWFHRMVQPNMDNQGLTSKNFHTWLAERFNANDGWDKIVKTILTASGERDENPEIVFWLSNVEGNNRRDVAPNKVAAAASQLFMGLKLECCECHNHPFDDGLKQTDFWGMAAFFTTTHADKTTKPAVQSDEAPSIREPASAPRPMPARAKAKAKAKGKEPAAFGQIVIPDSNGKTVNARYPLGESARIAPGNSLRTAFADWLISPRNPFFAKAAVNKVWAQLFGQGIVDPVDDMRPGARNTHPDLLDELAREFAASGYDQKHLIRGICRSNTYQRTSKPLPENRDDDRLFSHMRLKAMSADQLYDSLAVVMERSPGETGRGRPRPNAGRRNQGDARDQFRRFFHAEADDDAGVVEEYTHGIPQVLRLMNSQAMNATAAIVQRQMRNATAEEIIESLYLRVLARKPTEREAARLASYVAAEPEKSKALGDVMWALVNSAEFMFNH
jgi:hypothetical protein